MKRIVLFGMALLCIVGMNAQDRFYYSGPQLSIAKNQFTCVSVGKLDGTADFNYQGMDPVSFNPLTLPNKRIV